MTTLPNVDPWILETIATLPGTEVVPYPEWGAQTLQVAGKHFGRVGTDPGGRPILTLKGDPDNNLALVQEYDGISPGYYTNKRLWVSIALDDELIPREVVVEALVVAFEIVKAGLPKYVQAELNL
ncbi:MmcQ/YjbR family DNA-binding protein [Demequina sediminicola]|uniref:MmcQ/YjbR family DNA-binding protein n=1 Tax=Demequina sediminicola TaxID=1095026 RepID=UPI00128AE931|nr:MmcQ/YjbR family DNA-binding protein [Demequina sediminicola]